MESEEQVDNFDGYGVEVFLKSGHDFLKIRETLSRIGIPNFKNKSLTQTCYILHIDGQYVIMHFKELFGFIGRNGEMSQEDIQRRNKIVALLVEWELLEMDFDFEPGETDCQNIKFIKFAEKSEWELKQKFNMNQFKRFLAKNKGN